MFNLDPDTSDLSLNQPRESCLSSASSDPASLIGGTLTPQNSASVGFSAPSVDPFQAASIEDYLLNPSIAYDLGEPTTLGTYDIQTTVVSNILSDTVDAAQDLLLNWAGSAEFAEQLAITFDQAASYEAAAAVIQQIAEGDLNEMVSIQIGSDEMLGIALGSYDSVTNTVFLADDLFAESSDMSTVATSVLLEELGHFVDKQIGDQDSTGDEGAIFSAYAQGIDLSNEMLTALKAEDDFMSISLDGQSYLVEQSQVAMTELNGTLYQTHRGTNNNMYIRASTNGRDWSGWQKIGNDGWQTHNAPEIEAFDGKLYISHRGLGDQIFVGRIDPSEIDGSGNVSVQGNRHVDGTTSDAVALKAHGDQLYAFVRGTNNEIYVKTIGASAPGSDWVNDIGGWQHLDTPTGSTSTPDAIAVESHTDLAGRQQLYVAHRSERGDMYIGEFNPQGSFQGWTKLNGSTQKGMALASANGQLYITHTGGDGTIYSGVYQGGNHVSWQKQARTTTSEVSLEAFGNKVIETHHSASGQIYTFSTNADGNVTSGAWTREHYDQNAITPNDFDPSTMTPEPDVTGSVIQMGGPLNIRSGPGTGYSDVGDAPSGASYRFDGWTNGHSYTKLDGGRSDVWYRIEGSDHWVAGDYIEGIDTNQLDYISPSNSSSSLSAKLPDLIGIVSQNAPTTALTGNHIFRIAERAFSAGLSLAQTAYVLATAQHESGMGYWMEEIASGSAYEGRSDLGNTQPGDGVRFKGRGYVQITGRTNYQKYSSILGFDLTGNPELVENPEIAVQILIDGMQYGRFTGVGLSRYINDHKTDFYNARRIVNGTDRANAIADIAYKYLNVLKA